MLDSSNQQSSLDDIFDPNSFIRKLCVNSKIEIPNYVNVRFPPGWQTIIVNLIKSIKAYPVRISEISDTLFILDVKFEILKPTKEVNIWRAIEEARNHSVSTCGSCGGAKGFRRKHYHSEILCESCFKNGSQLGRTQTWLDKY